MAFLAMKGNSYEACACVRTHSVHVCAMKRDDLQRLHGMARAEKMMVWLMCGVTLKNRVSN